MSFLDDLVSVVKDIHTSTARIVVDTAIDLANVATALQFEQEMDGAKKAMKDAGIYSASEAIERRHYGFLTDMEAQAKSKYQLLTETYQAGDSLAAEVNARKARFIILGDQLDLLARESSEYEAVYARVSAYPEWVNHPKIKTAKIIPLDEINQYKTKWQEVGKWIAVSSLTTNGATLVSSLTGMAAAARAAQLMKVSRLGQVARFAKLANVAGKASVVLTVVSIGLDIGLSVAQLEDKKSRLESYLRDVDAELDRGNRALAELKEQRIQIDALIAKLVEGAGLKNDSEWERWCEMELARIRESKTKLVTVVGSIERAQKLIEANRDYRKDRLKDMILASEPELEDIVSDLIDRTLRQLAA